jgi:hypothetical protein
MTTSHVCIMQSYPKRNDTCIEGNAISSTDNHNDSYCQNTFNSKINDYASYYINTGIIPLGKIDALTGDPDSDSNTEIVTNLLKHKECCSQNNTSIDGDTKVKPQSGDGLSPYIDCVKDTDGNYTTDCIPKTTYHACLMTPISGSNPSVYNTACPIACVNTLDAKYERSLEQTKIDKETIHRNQKQMIDIYNKTINKNYNELENINDTLTKSTKTITDSNIEFKKENMISTTLSIFIFMFIISTLIYIIFYTFFTDRNVSNYINKINSYNR